MLLLFLSSVLIKLPTITKTQVIFSYLIIYLILNKNLFLAFASQ